MSDSNEHRRAARVPFILRVDYPNRSSFSDATENLSRNGLFVQTELAFRVGQVVPLSLSFPGLLDPVEIVGRVAWLRPTAAGLGAGVGFSVDDAADTQRLEKLLSTVPVPSPPASAATAPKAPLPPGGFKVLIVEDNPHVVEMYSYVLKKLAAGDLKGQVPLEVHFASDGHQALQQLRAATFSLVMTDVRMPVMDGIELVRHIRADAALKGVPIVAISAAGDEKDRAVQAGVDIFLKKPVQFATVLETVKKLLHI